MKNMPQIASKSYLTQTQFIFHCHIKIKIPLAFGEALLEQCFQLLRTIDATYNSYQPHSYIGRLNRCAGNALEVDATCIQLIQSANTLSKLTDGQFDISCMALIRLWGFYKQEVSQIPTADEISACLKKVDYQSILIEGNQIQIAPQQEIITASFLKSYAVDQVIAFLRRHGVSDALINAGGSTIAALNNASHPEWKIYIPDPFNLGTYSKQIRLSNACFSLSGSAHNHIVIQDQVFGHIINAKTGYPSETAQLGVLSAEAALGDMLSTALFSLSDTDFPSYLNKLKNHYDFSYFRIARNQFQSADACF